MRKVFTTSSMPAKEQLIHQAPWKATVTASENENDNSPETKLKIT